MKQLSWYFTGSKYLCILLVAHAGEGLLKVVARRVGDLLKAAGILLQEQHRFRAQRSTTDIVHVVRELEQLSRAVGTPNVLVLRGSPESTELDRW